ncbi:Serine protease inhibitor [Glycomyces sambucus]|uniref:Serine protease inhibitor n=1 Tax=Glycomyces sambucus TaxID=380244 RepID=A0A1G9HSK7_9ACTN|nr:serpin family protein [Glycomyces sambucus]SDL15987.1 Serine protease inhibitor [Glycomyces sambucus]
MSTALQDLLTPADVAAANALTRRWLVGRDQLPSAASGLGIWPLLAMLSTGAVDETRAELLAALGLDADRAAALPRALLDGVRSAPALNVALGVWAGPGVVLDPDWAAALPVDAVGSLTGDTTADKAHLDRWAEANTGGLIDAMPIDLDAPEPIELLLASALMVRTEWATDFEESTHAPFASGPWAGLERPRILRATYHDDVLRCTGDATVLTVRGRDDVDVLLALGGDHLAPHAVMDTLVDAVDPAWGRSATELKPGERAVGVRVSEYTGSTPQTGPEIGATTVAFDATDDLDLTADKGALGLVLAADRNKAQFDRLTAKKLYVSQAKQSCTARFSATGFEAAAVTAVGMAMFGSVPVFEHPRVRHEVAFDRPFAYLAVHRPTGLVLVAGWVAAPALGQD